MFLHCRISARWSRCSWSPLQSSRHPDAASLHTSPSLVLTSPAGKRERFGQSFSLCRDNADTSHSAPNMEEGNQRYSYEN